MTKIIAALNQKGGSAKSVTVVNLACAFSYTKRKILVIDLDPQGSATNSLIAENREETVSLATALVTKSPIKETILSSKFDNIDIIPSDDSLISLPVALYNEYDAYVRLKLLLKDLKQDYAFILIDTPPALNLLTINAICAADFAIVPVQCEFFAIESLVSLFELVEKLKQDKVSHIEILGVLRSLYDENNPLHKEISQTLNDNFHELLLKTIIPFTQRFSEASMLGSPIMVYDRSSIGSKSYLTLAGEILNILSKKG